MRPIDDWYLGYEELERAVERIRELNAAGLMRDYDATATVLRPKENRARLAWYRQLAMELARLASGWISTARAFRLKMDLGRQAWLFVEIVGILDERISELPGVSRSVENAEHLRELRLRLSHARNEEEFVVGVYGVVVAQLLLALEEHRAHCDPLADWPTKDRIERACHILREQLAWARTITEPYTKRCDSGEVRAWCAYVAALFARAGGARGEPIDTAPQSPFSEESLVSACAEPSRLEPGYNVTEAFMMAEPRVTAGALSDVLFHNWAELIVPEGLGYMIYDVDGLPWGFYRDFIRQIWDECRHTEMGRRELEKLGVDVPALPMNRLTRPPTYTEMLCVIGFTGEACSFPRKFESVAAFYKHGHPSAALVTEYDIVDEHDHVSNIRKWLPELHRRERIATPLEQVIAKVQTEALERWATTRANSLEHASRARQSVGKFGAFCREVDFELNFDAMFSTSRETT